MTEQENSGEKGKNSEKFWVEYQLIRLFYDAV